MELVLEEMEQETIEPLPPRHPPCQCGLLCRHGPRVLPALWSAAWRQEHLTSTAVEHSAVVQAMNQGIGLRILTATAAGLLLTGGLIVLRLSRLAADWRLPACSLSFTSTLRSCTCPQSVWLWRRSPPSRSASCKGRRPSCWSRLPTVHWPLWPWHPSPLPTIAARPS